MAINEILIDDRFHWNTDTGICRFELGDKDATIIYSASLSLMREFLDFLEATGRLPAPKHTSAT